MPFGFPAKENVSEDTKTSRGWRKGVIAAASLTGVVLIINLLFLLISFPPFPSLARV